MKKNKKFKIWARTVSYCYLEIEAKDEQEALTIAEETDGGYFIPDESIGDFELLSMESQGRNWDLENGLCEEY